MTTTTEVIEAKGANFTGRKKASRSVITERDALLLAFLAKFPGATAEALSMLVTVEPSHLENRPAGGLLSIERVKTKLMKLVRMGAAEYYRNPFEVGEKWYGATEYGVEAAIHYGYDMTGARGIGGLSLSRMNHYAAIALTAASLASPVSNAIQEAVGGAVKLDMLASENLMRATYESERKEQKEALEAGATDAKTWKAWRAAMIRKAFEEVRDGNLELADMVPQQPALLTIGGEEKSVLQPDIAILLDAATGRSRDGQKAGRNLLVEVELSLKPGGVREYTQRLQTLNSEIASKNVYRGAVYVVGNTGIGNMIKRADGEVGLIASGWLKVVPLTGRDAAKDPVKTPRIPTHNPLAKPKFIIPGE